VFHAKTYHFCMPEGILNQNKPAVIASIFTGCGFPHSLDRLLNCFLKTNIGALAAHSHFVRDAVLG